ncbi:MAG TPA: SDR family NAD(P)-dependent oxidoreductase [Acidimicrobiales bacterium]|nr:SDR family NAD(P)-dependent oxidoreductase [Acidimicrobiales bacterium]
MSRVAVVTGGASGIGLGISTRLARAGHKVSVFDIQEAETKKAAEELGATGHVVDVGDRAAVDAAIDAVRAELGPIEIMVTSAGIDADDPLKDITVDRWEEVLRVNLTGTFNCIQSAVPDMIEAGWGRIVTISSSSAQSGAPNRAHYVASKGGVIALTKALAVDLSPHGITVNTIPPSIIDTPMLRQAESEGRIDVDMVAKMTRVGRVGTPDDIAAACEFLCSEDAGFITGQQIGVNGGWYL